MSWLSEYAARFHRSNGARRPGSQVVYCVSEGPGSPVKIGVTAGLDIRFRQLQVHTWRELTLHWAAEGYSMHECALKQLSAGRTIHGEWFHDPDDRLKGLLCGRDRSEAELVTAIAALASSEAAA